MLFFCSPLHGASIMSIASAMLSSLFSTQSDNSPHMFSHTGIVFLHNQAQTLFFFKSNTRYILSSAPIFPFRSIPFLTSAFDHMPTPSSSITMPQSTHTMGLPIVSACIQKLCCHWFCKMLFCSHIPLTIRFPSAFVITKSDVYAPLLILATIH